MESTVYSSGSKSHPGFTGIDQWIFNLGSPNGVTRQEARLALVKIGKDAVPALCRALHSQNVHTRWEAAKAFVALPAYSAAPDLVDALRDEDAGVRWLAGEALIGLKRAAVVPLLEGLQEHFDSTWMREGAHHVLYGLHMEKLLDQPLSKVKSALEDIEPEAKAPWAAYEYLDTFEKFRGKIQ